MLFERRTKYQSAAYHTRLDEEHQKLVQQSEKEPTLFGLVEAWLERIPFLKEDEYGFNFWEEYKKAAEKIFEGERQVILANTSLREAQDIRKEQLEGWEKRRDAFLALLQEDKHGELQRTGQRRLSFKATQAALLITLYCDEPLLNAPCRCLMYLVDVDNGFQEWRHKHSLMVHRMIGTKIGTGGSSGYYYLQSTLSSGRIFSDISNLSTYLLPRNSLPELPLAMIRSMNFNLFSSRDK